MSVSAELRWVIPKTLLEALHAEGGGWLPPALEEPLQDAGQKR